MKKKCHTKKNIIISNEDKYVGYLWPTVSWKSHDYGMFKKEFNKDGDIFIESNLLLDLWFFWIVWDYWSNIKWILIPEKKKRKTKNQADNSLTDEQKESNKIISSFRIKVENAIWWAKRFGALSQIFRNKSDNFCDEVMETACALWNLHLLF